MWETPAQVPDLYMLQDEELLLCPHMPQDKLNDQTSRQAFFQHYRFHSAELIK